MRGYCSLLSHRVLTFIDLHEGWNVDHGIRALCVFGIFGSLNHTAVIHAMALPVKWKTVEAIFMGHMKMASCVPQFRHSVHALIVGHPGQVKFFSQLFSLKIFHHESLKVQPPANEISFMQPGRGFFVCVLFFSKTLLEIPPDSLWGPPPEGQWSSAGSRADKSWLPEQFWGCFRSANSIFGQFFLRRPRERTGGLRCVTLRLGSNLIICDGPYCAEALECVSQNPGSVTWGTYRGALGAGDVMSDVRNLAASEAVWLVRMIYKQDEVALTTWVFVSLQSCKASIMFHGFVFAISCELFVACWGIGIITKTVHNI